MDFELTDEQRLIQDTVRTFVDERVLPVAIQNDIDHKLDLELIEGMAELGILGIVIPEEYGGAGLDFVAEALACEEIERGEAAFRTLISVHVGLNSLSLLKYASEEQKQRWLTPQAKGEKLACFGLTEPGAGSDVAAMRSTARREGDVYVLNGQKNWISYATVADHALVFAKTDPAAGAQGDQRIRAREGHEGLHDARHGAQARHLGRLDRRALLRERRGARREPDRRGGPGLRDRDALARPGPLHGRRRRVRRRSRVPRAVGRVRARARDVRPGDRRYQFVQDMIAKMVLGYETSKLLVMQAAWMKNEGKRNTRETSLAKWHATESAFEAAHLAIQVFGSYGYSGEYGIERYFRNARAPIIYEGTTQIHKMMQAEHALGYRSLNGRTATSRRSARGRRRWRPSTPPPSVESAEVVIVGGGALGASVAWHLADLGITDVVLLERDTLASGSTRRSAGGFRMQFGDELNVRIAQRSLAQLAERWATRSSCASGATCSCSTVRTTCRPSAPRSRCSTRSACRHVS